MLFEKIGDETVPELVQGLVHGEDFQGGSRGGGEFFAVVADIQK